MYRNNERGNHEMVSARRIISKRVTKMSYPRKVLKNEDFAVSESGLSVKMCLGFWASFRLEWTNTALFKENRKNGNWVLQKKIKMI